MAAEIERIVDRKLVRNRVQYLVVWKGFGDENNTWESRVDLLADGYSTVVRQYEDARKKSESGASTPTASRSRSPARGRSPGRGKSPSRKGRSRSASLSRGRSPSASRSTRQSSSKTVTSSSSTATGGSSTTTTTTTTTATEAKVAVEAKSKASKSVEEPPVVARRSSRKQAQPQFVSRLDHKVMDEDEISAEVMVRSAAKPLQHHVVTSSSSTFVETSSTTTKAPVFVAATPVALEDKEEKQPIVLAYEETKKLVEEEESVLLAPSTQHSKQPRRWAYQSGGVKDLVAKLTTQSTWLVSFCSVLVVLGSLVASQLVPVDAEQEEVWRQWLPFLTPVVALLLFFHQRDARFSAKWVAVALAWRCAAELLIVLGSTPSEHLQVVLGSMALANASLLVSLISLFRNKEHQQAKASLFVLVLGSLGLFLADSWLVTTENPVLESRVILMSVAVMTISLSAGLTTSVEDDD